MYHFTFLRPELASHIVSVFVKRTSKKSDKVMVFPQANILYQTESPVIPSAQTACHYKAGDLKYTADIT
jgi:hypothetical protein